MEVESDFKTALDPGGRLLRLKQVLSRIPISRSAWYSGIKNGKYPKPVKLGLRISAWREEEIEDVIRNPR